MRMRKWKWRNENEKMKTKKWKFNENADSIELISLLFYRNNLICMSAKNHDECRVNIVTNARTARKRSRIRLSKSMLERLFNSFLNFNIKSRFFISFQTTCVFSSRDVFKIRDEITSLSISSSHFDTHKSKFFTFVRICRRCSFSFFFFNDYIIAAIKNIWCTKRIDLIFVCCAFEFCEFWFSRSNFDKTIANNETWNVSIIAIVWWNNNKRIVRAIVRKFDETIRIDRVFVKFFRDVESRFRRKKKRFESRIARVKIKKIENDVIVQFENDRAIEKKRK